MAQKDNEIQKSLRSLLGRKDLDPLEQTVFETGPRAGFQPPETAQVYQEGRTVFAEQPISVDRSAMDWYSLGQNAFKIAQDTFGGVLDYLVDSKKNALAETKNKYEDEINKRFEALQYVQAQAKETGVTAQSKDSADKLITDIRTLRNQWQTEAAKAVGNNEDALFQPKIDYWDENLDVKQYGLKYQELAVAVRAADRDIDRTIRRTEWDAISLGLGKAAEVDNRLAVKSGELGSKNDVTYNRVITGELPIPLGSDGYPIQTSANMSLGYNFVDGRKVMRTNSAGQPIFIVDENGNHRFNPAAGHDWFANPVEVDAYLSLAQDYYANGDSFLFDVKGNMMPDTAKEIQRIVSNMETQTPASLYYAARVVSALPPDAVPRNVSRLGLSKEQGEQLVLMGELARSGGGFESMGAIRGMQPKEVTQVVRFVDSLRGDRMLLSGGVKPEESYGYTQDVSLINNYFPAIVSAALGLNKDEADDLVDKLTIEVATSGRNDIGLRDVDPSDGYAFGLLLDQYPEVRAATMHSMAFLLSNTQAVVDSSGNFDEDKLKTLAEEFTKKHMALTGMVRVYQPDGTMSVVRNEGLIWTTSFTEGIGEEKPKQWQRLLNASLVQPDIITGIRGVNQNQTSFLTSVANSNIVTGSDIEVIRAVLDETRTIVEDPISGINSSTIMSPDILLRLQVAAHPNSWRMFGQPLPENATIAEKMERTRQVFEAISPLSEWGFSVDNREDLIAYSRSPNGGLPLGFKKIPATLPNGSTIDLLTEIVPPTQITGFDEATRFFTPVNQNGLPVLSLPAYSPGTEQANSFGNRVSKERLAQLNGKTATRLAFKETAPVALPLTDSEVIQNSTFVGTQQIAHQLKFAETLPLTDAETALNDIRLNGDVIVKAAEEVAELDPAVKKALPVLKEELSVVGGTKKLFSESNMKQIVEQAKAQGASTMADLYSFLIGVAKSRHLNLRSYDVEKKAMARNASIETGVPIYDTDFVITAGNRTGMILQKPDTADYWAKLKTAANSGYNIYRDPTENRLYIAKETPKTIVGDVPMELIFNGKTTETDEEFETRFTSAFKVEVERTNNKQIIRSMIQPLIDREYVDYTQKRTDMTILPSRYKEDFDRAYKQFREDMKLNSDSVNPRDAALAYNYDWAAYWRDNNSFPLSLENLPPEYIMEDKAIPIPAAKAVEQIRETYEIPINQTDMNKALVIFSQDSFPSESDTLDNVDMERIKRFKMAGWHPAAFEYQVRVIADKKQTTNLRELLKNVIKPDVFVLDSVVRDSLQADWQIISKKLQETKTKTPKGSAYPDPLYPEVYYAYNKQFDRLMTDEKYAIDFKQAYLLEIIAPSGRTDTSTTKERRLQLLIDVLNRTYSD